MIISRAIERIRGSGEDNTLTLGSIDGWNNPPMAGGVNQANAMKVSAVNACVETLSNSLAKLPFHVIHRETKEKKNTQLSMVISRRPNEAMAPSIFKKLIEVYRLLWGNAYVVPIRSPSTGRIQELIPVPPEYVMPMNDEDGVLWYVVSNPQTGEQRKFRSWDMVHLKAYTQDGITGISVLSRAAEVVKTARAAQGYEGSFYTNNAKPSGVLTYPTKLDKEAKDKVRQEWHKIHSGADKAFKVAVLDLGIDYKQIGMSNSDAQFVESKNVTVEDIARFFMVPLHKIMSGKQSYQSNEQNAIEYVTNTLHPIVEQYEEEMSYKLLFDSEIRRGYEVKANLNAELRGDARTRATWYKGMRESGAYSVNDILAFEDMPPVAGGDVRLASLNYVPLEDFKALSDARNKGGDS